MTNQELLSMLKEKKLYLKKLGKLGRWHIKKVEGTNEFFELAEIQEQKKSIEFEIKKLKESKKISDLEELNDIKMNAIHTKEGLERREAAGVIMSEGNFFRLINAFMFFTDYTDKSLPLLDIGTREGWMLEFLIKAGYKDVQAIEICPEAITLAKNKGLRIAKMDVQKMDVQNKFGTITAIHVLEHCSNPKIAVSNMYKALKERGILYLEIPLEDRSYPMKSGHFSSFPNEGALFNLFNKKWKRLAHDIIIMNKAGTKRNLRTMWVK